MSRCTAGGMIACLFAADQVIKRHIEENYDEKREEKTRIPHVILRKFYNRGMIFSSFEKVEDLPLKASVVGLVAIALANLKVFLQKGGWICKIGLILATAGALSNTYDRIMKGAVVDYIGYDGKGKYLKRLTANLADFYVVLGALLVALRCARRK